MKAFPVSVLPELSSLGDTVTLKGTYEESSFTVGGQEFATPTGVVYDVQLTNTGEAILLSGTASVHAVTECARCLEAAEVDVKGEVQGYYLQERVKEVEGMEPDEYDFVDEEGNIDLSVPLLAALVHEMPYVVLCSEDCKGLCPTCGENLNNGTCSCDADEVDPMNPFAALKDFKFADDGDES